MHLKMFKTCSLSWSSIQGGDLFTLLGKQEDEILDVKIAKFYLVEIVLALHSLHELGYVHRYIIITVPLL